MRCNRAGAGVGTREGCLCQRWQQKSNHKKITFNSFITETKMMRKLKNKSSFNKTTLKIELGENFEKKLMLIHIEIEKLKKDKISIYSYVFIYVAIGCTLIISQRNFFNDFEVAAYRRTSWPLLLIFLGFGLISLAYSKLIQHLKNVRNFRNEKEKLDSVLNKHQIEYSCNVEFGEKYLGNQDVNVELKSNSNLLKDSKVTLQI